MRVTPSKANEGESPEREREKVWRTAQKSVSTSQNYYSIHVQPDLNSLDFSIYSASVGPSDTKNTVACLTLAHSVIVCARQHSASSQLFFSSSFFLPVWTMSRTFLSKLCSSLSRHLSCGSGRPLAHLSTPTDAACVPSAHDACWCRSGRSSCLLVFFLVFCTQSECLTFSNSTQQVDGSTQSVMKSCPFCQFSSVQYNITAL